MTRVILPRRRFLFGAAAAVAAASLAPAIVRAANLMPISTRNPVLWGDGVHDDTSALQAMIRDAARKGVPCNLPPGNFFLKSTLVLNGHAVAWNSAAVTADHADTILACDCHTTEIWLTNLHIERAGPPSSAGISINWRAYPYVDTPLL